MELIGLLIDYLDIRIKRNIFFNSTSNSNNIFQFQVFRSGRNQRKIRTSGSIFLIENLFNKKLFHVNLNVIILKSIAFHSIIGSMFINIQGVLGFWGFGVLVKSP